MVALTLRAAAGGLALLAAGLAQPAYAQYIGSNAAEYNAGYGRTPGQENRITDYGTRDLNGNRVIVDGMILSGEDQSVFASASAGVSSSVSGVGSMGGGSTAIGNNLVVVTQGNYNTVIVTSNQVNNGDVTAGTTVTGGGNGQ